MINWISSKLKTSTQRERIMKTMNRQAINYQKIFLLDKSNKGLVYRIHKELSQHNSKKQKQQLKNGNNNKKSSDIEMAKSTWRSIQHHQSSGEWKCKRPTISKLVRCRTARILIHRWQGYKIIQEVWETLWQFLITLNM